MNEKEIRESIKALTVQIITPKERGTGVLVSYQEKHYILTVEHVIFGKKNEKHSIDAQDIESYFFDGSSCSISAIFSFEGLVLLQYQIESIDFAVPKLDFTKAEYETLYFSRGFPPKIRDGGQNFEAYTNEVDVDKNTFKIEAKLTTKDTSGEDAVEYMRGFSGSGLFTTFNGKLYLVGLVNALATQSGTFDAILCTNLNALAHSSSSRDISVENLLNYISKSLKKNSQKSLLRSFYKNKKSIYIALFLIFIFSTILFLSTQHIESNDNRSSAIILEKLAKIEEKTALGEKAKPLLIQLLGVDYLDKLTNEETYNNLLKLLNKKNLYQIIDEQKKLQETVKNQSLSFDNYQEIERAFKEFRYSDVRKILDKFLDKFKEQEKMIAKAHYLKALSYKEEFDFYKAEKEFEKGYVLDEKNYGMVNEYAETLLHLSKYEKILQVLHRISNDINNTRKMATLNKIALAYMYLGKYKMSETLYIELIKIHIKNFGDEYFGSYYLYGNLGGVYDAMNKYDKAEKNYLKAIRIIKKIHTNSHELATQYNNLGRIYIFINKYKKAEKFLFKSLEIENKIWGKDSNPFISVIYNNLGLLYNEMNLYKKSEEFYLKDLNLALKFFNENHYHIAITYMNLGDLYMKMKKFKKAKKLFEKSLVIQRNHLKEPHKIFETLYLKLGDCSSQFKEYDKAELFYTKSLNSAKKRLEEGTPELLMRYIPFIRLEKLRGNEKKAFLLSTEYNNKVFWALVDNGKYNKAINFYNEELKTSGDTGFISSFIYNGLGAVYFLKKEYDKALEYYDKSLKNMDENSSKRSEVYLNIADVWESKKDYNKTIFYHKKSLDLKVQNFEEKKLSDDYFTIGSLYLKNKNYNEAIDYFKQSLKIDIETLGKNHKKLAITNANIGYTYVDKKAYSEALPYLLKALEIDKHYLAKDNDLLLADYFMLAKVYFKQKKYQKSHKIISKILQLKEKKLPKNHPDIIQIKEQIKKLEEEMNR